MGHREEEYSQLEMTHIGLTTELEKRERILSEARRVQTFKLEA